MYSMQARFNAYLGDQLALLELSANKCDIAVFVKFGTPHLELVRRSHYTSQTASEPR